ncbi:MAG: MBL fold metallo-hydrolase [Burkholderiales bacterium]|nr:MBL fold metallo-hydrolase [Burkholderiales bacterium]
MARLVAISGSGAKGPACFMIEAGAARFMLDLGYGPQPGLWPSVDSVGRIDALLLSHGHRDHAGGLSLLPKIGNPPVYATATVARMLPPEIVANTLPEQGVSEVLGVRVETGRSGHAPGGVWIHLALGNGVLYMGDYSIESMVYAYDPPPPAELVILDASYGGYETALAECQKNLDPLFDEARLLLPVPEGGRGPEIALHLVRSGRDAPYIDEAMRSALRRLANTDHASLREGVAADLARLAATAKTIDGPLGVMLASRADATAGEAARLIGQWEHAAEPGIVFTGYIPPGTPAERLTRSGRAKYLRWNVHPRLSDNAALVRSAGARTVVPAFGEARHLPAWQRAFAPARVVVNQTVEL